MPLFFLWHDLHDLYDLHIYISSNYSHKIASLILNFPKENYFVRYKILINLNGEKVQFQQFSPGIC